MRWHLIGFFLEFFDARAMNWDSFKNFSTCERFFRKFSMLVEFFRKFWMLEPKNQKILDASRKWKKFSICKKSWSAKFFDLQKFAICKIWWSAKICGLQNYFSHLQKLSAKTLAICRKFGIMK